MTTIVTALTTMKTILVLMMTTTTTKELMLMMGVKVAAVNAIQAPSHLARPALHLKEPQGWRCHCWWGCMHCSLCSAVWTPPPTLTLTLTTILMQPYPTAGVGAGMWTAARLGSTLKTASVDSETTTSVGMWWRWHVGVTNSGVLRYSWRRINTVGVVACTWHGSYSNKWSSWWCSRRV